MRRYFTAVKSADMSGGRPEVILPQDPTPVLGLCVLGFPLWAPPWFSAIQLGLGSAPHCTPDWTTYEGDLKGHLIPGVLSLFCFLLSCEEEKDGQRLFGQKKARVQYSFTKHSLTRFVPLSTWGTQEHFGEKLFKLPPPHSCWAVIWNMFQLVSALFLSALHSNP